MKLFTKIINFFKNKFFKKEVKEQNVLLKDSEEIKKYIIPNCSIIKIDDKNIAINKIPTIKIDNIIDDNIDDIINLDTSIIKKKKIKRSTARKKKETEKTIKKEKAEKIEQQEIDKNS